MKEAWPSFEGEAVFIPLDIGHASNLAELHSFAEKQGYPWFIGQADLKMLSNYGVAIQSTKIAIDENGVIFYRAGYGEGTIKEWSKIIRSY